MTSFPCDLANLQARFGPNRETAYDGGSGAREMAMQRIGDILHHRARDDFGDGDHQEYVESSVRDAVLIGAAAALLIGVFVVSLI
jgi:hypothetical protein